MIRSFQEVLSRAQSLPPQRAAILFPHDQAVMQAVKEGLRRNYIDPVFDLCFSGRFKREELEAYLMGHGGLISYLGAHDIKEIEDEDQR